MGASFCDRPRAASMPETTRVMGYVGFAALGADPAAIEAEALGSRWTSSSTSWPREVVMERILRSE